MRASREQLLDLWQQKGRSILEFASPVFFSRLTIDQSKEIEECQRSFCNNLADQLSQLQQSLGRLGAGKAVSEEDSGSHKVGGEVCSEP